MSDAAERQKRYRRRRKSGDPSIIEALIESGRLGEWDDGDRQKIGRAMSQLIAEWCEAVTRNGLDPLKLIPNKQENQK